MALAKKGARKIAVGGATYRYKVSRWRRVSGWKPADAGLVDERWLAEARRFGLGDVADVQLGLAIELEDEPRSKLLVTYHARVVDGFLGVEQVTAIEPGLVRALIERARAAGWDPRGRGDVRAHVVENTGEAARPALLVWPEQPNANASYQNRVLLTRILAATGEDVEET